MRASKLFVRGLGLVCAFGFGVVRAADADDFYFETQAGVRWEIKRLFQYGLAVGYCPWNEMGFGVFADFTESNLRVQMGGEFRWFIEPFEVDLRAGLLQKTDAETNESSGHFLAAAGLSYLLAVSSSLSIKADARYHGFIGDRSTLFLGLGGRLLF